MTVIYHVLDQHTQVKDEVAEESKVESAKGRKRFSRWQSWGVTITAGAATAALVLTINIWVFIYVVLQFKIEDGIATIHRGTCTVTSNISTYGHLLINILGTLLLGASNAGAQLLSAPTRSDIARAHSKNRWMDIGVPSLRNLRTISRWRRFGWAVLMTSSIPLHLLYNSVLFTTSAGHGYVASLVTPEFIDASRDWNDMKLPSGIGQIGVSNYRSVMGSFWNTRNLALQGNLTRMGKRECLVAYGATNDTESDKRNLLVVTRPLDDSDTGANRPGNEAIEVLPLLDLFVHDGEDQFNDLDWRCGESSRLVIDIYSNYTCGEHNMVPAYKDDAGRWSIRTRLYQCSNAWRDTPRCEDVKTCDSPFIYDCDRRNITAEVDYCLAEQIPGYCSAKVSLSLLAVVMGCNVVKVLVLCAMAGMNFKTFRPLVTIGDAVKSFLEERESEAKDRGPIGVMDIVYSAEAHKRVQEAGAEWTFEAMRRDHRQRQNGRDKFWTGPRTCEVGTSIPKAKKFVTWSKHWYRAANIGACSPWKVCVSLCLIMLVTAAFMMTVELMTGETELNLKDFNFNTLLGMTETAPLTLYIIVPNIPQLLVSFAYIFYNNALTCMLLACETSQFASKRKFLRVSDPEGRQKSTYWLQLPYQYSIPLLVTMAFLHWLISRSLFFKSVEYYDASGKMSDESYTACAYSPLALILSISLGAILVLVLVGLSFRKVDQGMPMLGSCSMAISAACANCREGGEAAKKALMYGVLTTETDEQQQGPKRVGFSQHEVESLREKTEYL